MDSERNTIQRQLVYDAVKELDVHATAEQVYDYVRQSHPSISKATVYRNLNQMAESGRLLNIGSFCGSSRFDHNCSEHYHFMCEACGRVYDVYGDFSGVYGQLEGRNDFEISGFNISFTGLCGDCKQHSQTP